MNRLAWITPVVTVLAVTLGAVSLALGASAPPSRESWADTTHGWRLAGAPNASRSYPVVQATENGGRSWHTILRQPRFGISEISRTTATNGIAFVPRPRKPVLVTTDNGRHWKAVGIVPRGLPVRASGTDLFWLSRNIDARRLYGMRNALLGQTRTRVISSLPENWVFEAIEAVPGGVAALGNKFRPDDSKFQLVLYRYGKLRTHTIAQAKRSLVCPGDLHVFSVNWPVLTVVVEEATFKEGPKEYSCNFGSRTTAFVSTDGGARWRETNSR